MRLLIILICFQLPILAQSYAYNLRRVIRVATLTGGSINTLNGIKHIKIRYDYQQMKIGDLSEADYLSAIVKKRGEEKGNEYIEKWKQLPKTRFEPEFEKKFAPWMARLGVTTTNSTDTTGITMLVSVTHVNPKFAFEDYHTVPPYIVQSCTFFDSGRFLVSFVIDAYGSVESTLADRLGECYGIAGDELGKKIYYGLNGQQREGLPTNSGVDMLNNFGAIFSTPRSVKGQALVTKGSIDSLNTVKLINIHYDYTHMSVGEFQSETEYLDDIVDKRGEKRGQMFIEKWKQLPETCFEPEFERSFKERMGSLGIAILQDPDPSCAILKVRVIKIVPQLITVEGHKVLPYVTLSCTFSDHNELLVCFTVDAYGSEESNIELAMGECYRIAGEMLGRKVYGHLTDLQEAQQK